MWLWSQTYIRAIFLLLRSEGCRLFSCAMNCSGNTPDFASRAKVVGWQELIPLRAGWKERGQVVVWTNGCFDLLHVGHVRNLQAARRLGDVLIVGLNSDESIRRIKGPSRPIIPEQERAELLAALSCVDYVVVFNESTPEASLEQLKPDIHCKGEDYAPPGGKPIPEAAVVESYGGRIAFIPLVRGASTTDLVQRIRNIDMERA